MSRFGEVNTLAEWMLYTIINIIPQCTDMLCGFLHNNEPKPAHRERVKPVSA